MNNKTKSVFNFIPLSTLDFSLEQFEAEVQKAARAGATHVMLNPLEKSRWIWERDRTDPYPNWGMTLIALFKLIVPAELKEYLPGDYAQRNLATIKAQYSILRKHGLKAALHLAEPFYLPEEAYRDHPAWRGPRCDHPRRARNAYYSPCADNPEILDMYQRTFAALLKEIPIDYLYMHTNDCGSGLCWSTGLYDGPNGPAACRHISPADRIRGFLDVFYQAAAENNIVLDIEINSNIGIKEPEHAMDALWPQLPDHMSVNHRTNQGTPLSAQVDVGYEYSYAPVKNVPLVVSFAESLEKAYAGPAPIVSYTLTTSDFDEYYRLIEAFNRQPASGPYNQYALLRGVAADLAGEENADALLKVWKLIDTALLHYRDTNIEGLISCSVNQRWTNRPFVLFPAELSEEEKAYYRPYLFQANSETHAQDLLDIQNTTFIRGYYAIFLASRAMQRAIDAHAAAIQLLEDIDRQVPGRGFDLQADRLRLLNCFLLTTIHAMKFQDIVDHTDPEVPAEINPRWPIDAEPRLLEYEALTRAEIDNTNEVIRLITGRVRTMLLTAPTPELEDIFLFTPDLVPQLRRKTDIMLAHALDGKRVFVTNNK